MISRFESFFFTSKKSNKHHANSSLAHLFSGGEWRQTFVTAFQFIVNQHWAIELVGIFKNFAEFALDWSSAVKYLSATDRIDAVIVFGTSDDVFKQRLHLPTFRYFGNDLSKVFS